MTLTSVACRYIRFELFPCTYIILLINTLTVTCTAYYTICVPIPNTYTYYSIQIHRYRDRSRGTFGRGSLAPSK